MKATATITRQDDDTLTYRIIDMDGVGVVEVTIEALTELFEMAGIKPEAT